MFVSCVLHQGNHEHVADFAEHLFGLGLKGFFTSPVLKFTKNENIQNWAITPPEWMLPLNGFSRRLMT